MTTAPAFNPYLNDWQPVKPANEGGQGSIERVSSYENLPWQTRPRPLDRFEMDFIQVLESEFGKGTETLEGLVAGFNEQKVFDRAGNAWTIDSLYREFVTLGY